MDIKPEDDNNPPIEKSISTRGAQSMWPFSLAIVMAIAFQYTPLKDVKDNVNQYVRDQFAAATKPKSQQECMMMALSRSPPVGCSYDKK